MQEADSIAQRLEEPARPGVGGHGSERITIIEPSRGWRALDLKELWSYRELLWVLAERDVKVRYKQTVLGIAWAVLQPLASMIVFSILFGRLAGIPSDGLPYPVFVCAGLLPWLFFANTVTTSSNSLIGSANLLNKVYFPRLIIPFASVGGGIVDFAVSSMLLALVMLIYGFAPSWSILALPFIAALALMTALAVGTLLASVSVIYRDFRYVVPFMVQIWMFLTPVVYPATLVPEAWRWLIYLNPMTGIIEGFRSAFLDRPFDVHGLVISTVGTAAILGMGLAVFGRFERRFADRI